jgi:hypothetical protein
MIFEIFSLYLIDFENENVKLLYLRIYMKKKYIYVSIIISLIALTIVFFSLYWPPVDKSKSAGSFTKVERYRKEQANDKDILLRSEFISDTTILAKSIKDLVAFGDFSLQLKKLIDQYWIPQLVKYSKASEIQNGIDRLNEYSTFIQNNISTIQNTIEVLAGFYTKQNNDYSTDVESKIKVFYNYVNQLLVRDSLFEYTIAQIDNSIKNDNFRKAELSNIKSLRDKMVIETLIYGTAIGDTSKIKYSANQVIFNPKTLNETYKSIKLEMLVGSKETIGLFEMPSLGIANIVNQVKIESAALLLFSSDRLNVIFNTENLKIASNGNLKKIWESQANNLIAASGQQAMFLVLLNLPNVGLFINNGQLNCAMAIGQLNSFTAQSNQAFMGKFQLGLFSNANNSIFKLNTMYFLVL